MRQADHVTAIYRAAGSGGFGEISMNAIELSLHRQSQSPWVDVLLRMLRYRVVDLRTFVHLVRKLVGQEVVTAMVGGLQSAQRETDELMRLPLAAASVVRLDSTDQLALLDTTSGGTVVSIAEIRAELRRHATSREDEAESMIEDLRNRHIDMRILMRRVQETFGMSVSIAFATGLVTARMARERSDRVQRSANAARANNAERRRPRREPMDPLRTEADFGQQLRYIVNMILRDDGDMDDETLHERVSSYIGASLQDVRRARIQRQKRFRE
jgi:hypothetical protein